MMTMKDIHKGTIVKMHREPVTGASYLEIDDVDKGPTLIVCQGTPTVKGFNTVFPGTIVNGKFNNAAIAGKVIFYLLDPHGVFKSFLPIDQATPEEIEEFEQSRKEPSNGPGTYTDLGLLPPDDRVYSRGPVVAGRRLSETPKKKGKHQMTRRSLHRGTISEIFAESCAIALLAIKEDGRKKIIVVVCDRDVTSTFDVESRKVAFGSRTVTYKAIVGERIYFTLGDYGLLTSLTPEAEASPETIAEYEKEASSASKGMIEKATPMEPKDGKGTHTSLGLLPPDDSIYSLGPIVAGREILEKKPPKESGTAKVTVVGLLPPDHPIYSRGPMIFGRPHPPKKKSDEEN